MRTIIDKTHHKPELLILLLSVDNEIEIRQNFCLEMNPKKLTDTNQHENDQH